MLDRFLTAYIDIPFVERLLRECPDSPPRFDDPWPEVWQNLYRFLQRSAKVVIDADEAIFSENRQPVLTSLLLGSGQTSHLKCCPGFQNAYTDPNTVQVDDPFSLFLIEDQSVPVEDLRQHTGLLFLRYDELVEWWMPLSDKHFNVAPEDQKPFAWADLRPYAVPLNTIIIADKYAYQQFHSGRGSAPFEPNLGALIGALLPKEALADHVHFSLLTDLKTLLEDHRVRPAKVTDRIRRHIEAHHPDLDVYVTVYGYHRNSHKDRFIFTNYGLFTSNDSFAFFDDRGLDKSTMITYVPNATNGASVTAPRLRRLADVCSDPKTHPVIELGTMKKVLMADGDDVNRLLDAARSWA